MYACSYLTWFIPRLLEPVKDWECMHSQHTELAFFVVSYPNMGYGKKPGNRAVCMHWLVLFPRCLGVVWE